MIVDMDLKDPSRPCATIGCSKYIREHDPTAPYCSSCHTSRRRAEAAQVSATGLLAGDLMQVEVGGGWVRRPCEEDGVLIARGEHQIFVPAGQAEEALQAIGRCLPAVPPELLGESNGSPQPGPGELPSA